MRFALCPECRRTKALISFKGSKGMLFKIRRHHDPSEIDLMARIKGPLCRGSGKVIELDDTRRLLKTSS